MAALWMLFAALLLVAPSVRGNNFIAQQKAAEEARLAAARKMVVLVTGASSGIGKAIALEFASQPGYRVIATMRDVTKWHNEGGNETQNANIVVAPLDVTSDASVEALVESVMRDHGRIDVLVNNAGFGLSGVLESVTIAQAQRLFDVNVWGVVRMLQAVLPHMRAARRGYVVNLSSTSGIRGIPGFEFYTGSKFALEGITDSMRYSLAAFNISVTNVNPGPVRTAFTDVFGHADKGGRGTRAFDDATGYLEGLSEMMAQSLERRMHTAEAQSPEQVAGIVLTLTSMKFSGPGRATDVPFNIGTSPDSQRVLEAVKLHPTGWGGLYNGLLANLPTLVEQPGPEASRDEL